MVRWTNISALGTLGMGVLAVALGMLSFCGCSDEDGNPTGSKSRSVSRPVYVSASDGMYSSYVRVTWNDPNNPKASQYEIYRSRGNGSSFARIGSTSSGSYVDRSANPATVYEYKVRCVCGQNRSGWSSTDQGYRKSAEFYGTYKDVDYGNERIYFRTRLKTYGYKNRSLRLGCYWFRYRGGKFYYVPAKCWTDVPGGYIGNIWNDPFTPAGDITTYNNKWNWVHWDCFGEKTGEYWGLIKLYASSEVRDVNDPTVARSDYIRLEWNSGRPRVSELKPEEAEAFEAALTSSENQLIPEN